MKCPKCRHNHKRSAGMRCSCGYEFALDPKDTATKGFSDNRLVAAARKASGDGDRYYTANQLRQCCVKSRFWGRVAAVIVGGTIAVIGGLPAILGGEPAALLFSAFGVLIVLFAVFGRERVEPAPFRTALARYEVKKSRLPKRLLDNRPLDTPPPAAVEQDIFDYGVLGVLICQRTELVDLIVLNGVAAEQGLLVLAENGYPERLLPRLRQILDEQPDVPVYVLHDASAKGEAMATRVGASRKLGLDGHRVIDMGISRADVRSLGLLKSVRERDGSAPVDAVPWPKLTAGLTAAVVGQTTLAEAARQSGGTESSVSFG